MTDSPRCVVLIPSYNRAHTIVRAVASALGQRGVDVTVVVCDNGSSDDTPGAVRSAFSEELANGRVVLVENDKTVPIIENWNRLAPYSCEEYVKYLWSDDAMDPDFVETGIRAMQDAGDSCLIYSAAVRISVSGRSGHGVRTYGGALGATGLALWSTFLFRNTIGCPSGVLLRNPARLPIVFPSSRYCGDVLLLMGMLAQPGVSIVFDRTPRATLHFSAATETGSLQGSVLMLRDKQQMRRFMYSRGLVSSFPARVVAPLVSLLERAYFTSRAKVRRFGNAVSG